MAKKDEKKTKVVTDLAVIEESKESALAKALPGIFKNIDFEGLNGAIEVLGNKSGELTAEEKTAAGTILGEWNKNVIDRLEMHKDEMSLIVTFFNGGSGTYRRYDGSYAIANELFSDDQIEQMAEAAGTVPEFEAWMLAKEEHKNAHNTKPYAPLVDEEMTRMETLKAEGDYNLEYQRWDIRRIKAMRAEENARSTFLRATREHDQIRELIKQAEKQRRNTGKMINECNTKTSLAKLNIAISSQGIRDALKDLLNFTKTI
jgi:hypothetical protein